MQNSQLNVETAKRFLFFNALLVQRRVASLAKSGGLFLVANGNITNMNFFTILIQYDKLNSENISILISGVIALKKLIKIFIICILVILALGVTASAATSGYYTYSVSNGEATITDVRTSISGDIIIPSKLGGYPVTKIGSYAFFDCGDLTSIEIPDSVTTIGYCAFNSCDGLTSIEIGDSVTTIDIYAFYNCKRLTSINVNENNDNYCSIDGNLFDKNKTTLIQYAIGKTNSSYTIPDSVTTIGEDAFYNCESLTDVYYSGNEEQWDNIIISQGNNSLLKANIHFSSKPVEVEFKIYNNEPVSVLFTTYDTKSKMLNIMQKTIENAQKETVVVDSETEKYKVLYWESLANLKPLYAPIEKEF